MTAGPVGTLAEIIDWVGHYRPARPDLIPAVVRVHPTVYTCLRGDLVDWGSHDPSARGLLGLTVEVDAGFAEPAWRVSTADGTLLHDCRSGKKGS